MVSGPASIARCPAAALIRESSLSGIHVLRICSKRWISANPRSMASWASCSSGRHGSQKDQGAHMHLAALDHVR